MAVILNDTEISKLFGTVIKDADQSCVRPNSYILRLGSHGVFINTEKAFEISENGKKGIRLNPGYAVGITALEKVDFSHDAVEKTFPECDLHGFISPTTDLSREGLIAPSTQIDAGYKGTLNWTITNTSGKEAEFVYGEKLFRLTIVRLEKGERPELPYQGDYQEKEGYVPSRRRGAPRGMTSSDWVDAFEKDGPEGKIEELINSGYPWNILGSRLKHVDDQLLIVKNQYAEIRDSIDKLNQQIAGIQQNVADTVERLFSRREDTFILRLVFALGSFVAGLIAIISFLREDAEIWDLLAGNLFTIGVVFTVVCALLLFLFFTRGK